ncbi:MAG TPA: hypothetical protein VNI52_06535 [Sphingobacteriaceae bacterium]|nr:hypothetical protein [Sphingobacteriaceae bacterium]
MIGGSGGFTRPGYITSAEPGSTYKFNKFTLYTYVPVALIRNRTESKPDEIRSAITGTYYKGDAAFSDYSMNAGLFVKL